MIVRIAAVTIAALSLGGCLGMPGSGADESDGPPPGPEWMVGLWRTTRDMTSHTRPLELHRDGTFSILYEPIGTWASDGAVLELGDQSFDFVRSAGCHFMYLDENPVPGVFEHKLFVKLDIEGCPDAPAPLTATEQGLVGDWRLKSDYGSDYEVGGVLKLRNDRTAQISYSKSLSSEWNTTTFSAEGTWSYVEDDFRIQIRMPTFDGDEGMDFEVGLDQFGHFDWLCVSSAACVNVWPG